MVAAYAAPTLGKQITPPSRTTTESLAIVKRNVEAGEPRGPINAAITATETLLSLVGQGAWVVESALRLFETDR